MFNAGYDLADRVQRESMAYRARIQTAENRAIACLRELKSKGWVAEDVHGYVSRMLDARASNDAPAMEALVSDLANVLQVFDYAEDTAQNSDLRSGG